MKLDLYDYEPSRQAAGAAIDRWFGQQLGFRYPLAALHAAKARAAAVEPIDGESHALAAEAGARGLSLDQLRSQIRERAARQDADLLAFEGQRQDAKRALAAATTFAAIDAIHRRFA